MRLLLTRTFVVLGGSIAGTAVAWAIGAGSAAAESVSLDDLGLGPYAEAAQATAPVLESLVRQDTAGTASRVVDVLPARAEAVDAVRASEPLQVPFGYRPPSLGLPQATQVELPALPGLAEDTAQAFPAGVNNVGNEVVATTDVPAPDGASRARSQRTTSGVDGPLGGAGDAPLVHAPASVPPPPAPPGAAASGCPAGSSLLPALIGLVTAADAASGVPAVVATGADCGRPNTTGAQPGISPD